jgi:hypothetical protein
MFSDFPNDRHAISEFEKEGAKVTNSGERTKRPDASRPFVFISNPF